MKKTILLSTVIAAFVFVYKPANAQFSASINLGVQPAWGPSGYDYAENYYLPDVEAYYNVPSRQFVYFDRSNWIYSPTLPGRCGNYDLYNGYKVVINDRNPWFHFNDHRALYAPYRFRHDQVAIRDFRVGYGRGGYYGNDYRGYNDRGRGRDWGNDRRGDWGRDRRHDDHYDRGRGRW